jgi:hypothetical protein
LLWLVMAENQSLLMKVGCLKNLDLWQKFDETEIGQATLLKSSKNDVFIPMPRFNFLAALNF